MTQLHKVLPTVHTDYSIIFARNTFVISKLIIFSVFCLVQHQVYEVVNDLVESVIKDHEEIQNRQKVKNNEFVRRVFDPNFRTPIF